MTILGASVSPDGVGGATRAGGAGVATGGVVAGGGDGVGPVAIAGGVASIEATSNDSHPVPSSSALTSCRTAGAYQVENCQTGVCRPPAPVWNRSEEHTSELQSLAYLVCRLLLEKKNK